ncbi:MAG: hypothetical protein WDM92_07520 [Caulobacteraceae bacterium]
MTRAGVIGGTVAAALLAGCAAVGPNYHRPDNPAPAAYQGAAPLAAAPVSRVTADPADLARWWTQFRDPVLQSLVERALAGNLDLEAAASRIRQARQQVILAGAPARPTPRRRRQRQPRAHQQERLPARLPEPVRRRRKQRRERRLERKLRRRRVRRRKRRVR